ncbi:MAG TPA: MFS transporter [Actinomycetota bacterium]
MSDREDVPPIASRRARAVARARGIAVDLTPLRVSRDYRLLWLGEMASHTGRHITVVALPFQIYQLTGSPLAIGMMGLAQVVPLVILSQIGGVIADRVDRRRLLAITQVGLAAASLGLAIAASLGSPPLWFLYLVAAVIGGLSGIESPTRAATVPRLVGTTHVPSAIALEQTLFQLSDVIGPAIGGLVLASLGLSWAYALDASSSVVAFGMVLAMRPLPPDPSQRQVKGTTAFREGFRFLRGRRVLQAAFQVDLIAMVFGMPRALFPVLAVEVFHVGPRGLGLLYAAPGAGALLGALTSGWVRHVRRQGQAVLLAVVVWGLAIAAFGLTDVLWLALVLLGIAGAADMLSAIFRATILQLSIPDRLRGRLSAIHIAVVVGGPRLGDMEAGVVAAVVSPTFSVVSGGVATVIGVGVLAALVPAFVRYRSGDPA